MSRDRIESVVLAKESEASFAIHSALRGLEHLHALGMVHRDVKDANIMVSRQVEPGSPDVFRRQYQSLKAWNLRTGAKGSLHS